MREKADFCMQMAVMIQSRISISRALEILETQSGERPIGKVIERLGKEIQRGRSLSRAMESERAVFGELFPVMVEVGQETGRLGDVLEYLAKYLDKVSALKRKLAQALAYPGLVILVAFFAVLFLLMFIVPTFAEMFRSYEFDLPISTRAVIWLSDALATYGLRGLFGLFVLMFLVRNFIHMPSLRKSVEQAVIRIPIVGDIVQKNHIARFCRTLGMLLLAQVKLLDSLLVTEHVVTIPGLRSEIKDIIRRVKEGAGFSEPLSRSAWFPPMVAQMIAVGEETSELDSMLLKVADYYEKEIDGKIEILSSIIEPVIILILGVIVGLVLISMYLPMFDLINVIGTG